MRQRSDLNRLLLAGALGMLVSALIIWIPAHGHAHDATFGDGVLYRYVASHLDASPGQPGTLSPEDLPIRYGRVGLPALLWLLSGGQKQAMFYVQPIIMMISGGAIAAATYALFPGPILASLVPFAALGLSTSIAGGFAESLAIAFALWALVLIERGRWLLATPVLAAAILTKEPALAVLAGIVVWQIVRREFHGIVIAVSAVPFLGWGLFVAHRFGTFPLNDPWWKQNAVGPPFVSFWRTLSGGGAGAAIAAVHAVLALVALLIWRRSRAATIAALLGLAIFATRPLVWSYLGDGLRAAAFLEVFLIIAAIEVFKKGARDSDASALNPRP